MMVWLGGDRCGWFMERCRTRLGVVDLLGWSRSSSSLFFFVVVTTRFFFFFEVVDALLVGQDEIHIIILLLLGLVDRGHVPFGCGGICFTAWMMMRTIVDSWSLAIIVRTIVVVVSRSTPAADILCARLVRGGTCGFFLVRSRTRLLGSQKAKGTILDVRNTGDGTSGRGSIGVHAGEGLSFLLFDRIMMLMIHNNRMMVWYRIVWYDV